MSLTFPSLSLRNLLPGKLLALKNVLWNTLVPDAQDAPMCAGWEPHVARCSQSHSCSCPEARGTKAEPLGC